MDKVIKPAPGLVGTTSVPGDKSISHRAVMFAAIAEGETEIKGFSPAKDPRSTVDCIRQLGVPVEVSGSSAGPGRVGEKVTVQGRGLYGLQEPGDVLDAGNSGTTMRLLAGLLAGQEFFSVLSGDESLRQRPMGRITAPLSKMGAQILGRKNAALAPLAIRGGSLSGLEYKTPVASAQLKSALLLAGLYGAKETVVIEPHPSRDHTERMLSSMGARLRRDGTAVAIKPGAKLTGGTIEVPGDFSAAAFLLVAGCLVGNGKVKVTGVNTNPTRAALLGVLQDMGASIELENERTSGGEPAADIVASTSSLQAASVGGAIIPSLIDEIPVLAVAAAVARGKTVIRDARELRVKESDRIKAMAAGLSKMGAEVEELPDGLEIDGGRQLSGAVVDSFGDHRVAMALAVAGLVASGETVIKGWECVDISFPGFSEVLDALRGC